MRSSATSPTTSTTCSASPFGGRYTWDERTSDIDPRPSTSAAAGRRSSAVPAAGSSTSRHFTGSATFEEFTPRASVSFHPAEDHDDLCKLLGGLEGGGFDPRGRLDRVPRADRRRSQARPIVRLHVVRPRERSTATSLAIAPRCGTPAQLRPRRLLRRLYRRPGAGRIGSATLSTASRPSSASPPTPARRASRASSSRATHPGRAAATARG